LNPGPDIDVSVWSLVDYEFPNRTVGVRFPAVLGFHPTSHPKANGNSFSAAKAVVV